MMRTVLNVDDTAANRYLKSRALRQAGFRVIEAGTGQSALALALEERPDLVLLDIKLPDMSGLEVCRVLKSDPKTEHIPIVHISATFVSEEAKSVSMESGAEVYLAEPVGPHELTSTVRTVMRLRETERTLAESEERMRLATQGAGIATWEIVVGRGSSVWSPQFYALLGCDPATTPASLDSWLARARSDEREVVAVALGAALKRTGSFALEHWIVAAGSGEERCIAAFGTMQVDDGGQPRRLIGVAMDVTARKRAEAERELSLERARAQQQAAEEAASMKDEFLAILSHELRTPMSAVLGWLHLARHGGLTPEQREKALDTVERNARLQVQVVNDLLDVSRIVTGKLELESAVVGIERVLHNAVESARLAAAARGIELVMEEGGRNLTVNGSESRLQQVFNNLLSNAIKFSRDAGRVFIRVERREDKVAISVMDEGEGIAPDLLPRVFDIFRQADSSARRRHGGLGLGLAIVSSLVALHGGTIAAESRGRGHGATFIVALPLVPAGLADALPEPASSAEDAQSLRDIRVLVVDDDAEHVEMMTEMLRLEGMSVMTAASAADALLAVKSWKPEVLMLDIAMPGMDGYDLLVRMRRDAGVPHGALPAIAITGFASESDQTRARAAGFQGHLAKPFEVQALRRMIARVAARTAGTGPAVLEIGDGHSTRSGG
jgi:signal transduction histidine kinase